MEIIKESVLERGSNVFFTGAGGTGKSTLTRELVKRLELLGKNVAITASTGIAASNIGGVTFHSFVGCNLAKENPHLLAKKIKNQPSLLIKWLKTDVLIIDEISQIGASFFDRIEETARIVRSCNDPFGGIQMILVGDFLQLPPINDRFCFQAKCWDAVVHHKVLLTKVYRQSDQKYTSILSRLRVGDTTFEDDLHLTQNFHKRHVKSPPPVHTVSTRKEAESINKKYLSRLTGDTMRFVAMDYRSNGISREQIDRECNMKPIIELKIGARVMLTYNMDSTLVNGSCGVVKSFDPLMVSFSSNNDVCIELHTWKMSRNRKTHQEHTIINLEPEEDVPQNVEVTLATRTQVPLLLCYALTVHKAQGQTLEHQIAHLGRNFACGQMYTALSRTSDPNSLCIRDYSARNNRVSKVAVEFYETFER